MIDKNALKAAIVAKGLTQADLAERLGISRKTLYDRIAKGVFDSDEINEMIKILSIQDPISIFFVDLVTHEVTNTSIPTEPLPEAAQ